MFLWKWMVWYVSEFVNMKQKTQLKYISELINHWNLDASKILYSSTVKWKISFHVTINDISGYGSLGSLVLSIMLSFLRSPRAALFCACFRKKDTWVHTARAHPSHCALCQQLATKLVNRGQKIHPHTSQRNKANSWLCPHVFLEHMPCNIQNWLTK